METYDIIMLAVLGLATMFGFIKGLAWQIASLASLILSYVLALRFADDLAPKLVGPPINADPRWSKYLAMLIIYVGTSFVVWMAARVVSGTIDRIKLREFDRQIGGLFGFLKGVLYCLVITFFAVTLSDASRGAVLKSKSGEHIARLLHEAKPVMPPELAGLLGPYIEKLNQGLDPTQPTPKPEFAVPDGMQNPLPNFEVPGQPTFGPGYQPPQFNPTQPPYPPYQSGAGGPGPYAPPPSYPPAPYPSGFDFQNGQSNAPLNR